MSHKKKSKKKGTMVDVFQPPNEDQMIKFRAEDMVREEFMKSPAAKKAVNTTAKALKKAQATAKKSVRKK